MTMTAEARLRLIRGHLEATTRGRSPGPEQVGVWLRELEDIPTECLDDTIRAARAYHVEACDRGRRWGKITPDDVLAIWREQSRRTARGPATEPPEAPDCRLGCEAGRVLLVGADGYDFVTRCDPACVAGRWWAEGSTRWASMTPASEYLRNPAYRLARDPEAKMSDAHAKWLADRADVVGYAQAITEYDAHLARAEAGE